MSEIPEWVKLWMALACIVKADARMKGAYGRITIGSIDITNLRCSTPKVK